ncbi:MAG: homoserine kinase, partial [Bacilli bacterium]|nr:homoserine kinase [Bacilli bacterium]
VDTFNRKMQELKKKNNVTKKMMILTATSGDTGSAALSSFASSEDISISVLYPDHGISGIQERQMLYFTSEKSRAYALKESNFDDCQNIVKRLLNMEQDKIILSSANSINIGRLLPQVVYYVRSYIELVNNRTIKMGEPLDVVVPTGNFGNILASYIAKNMGVPFGKIVCASNENRVLTDFFETGVYSLDREFIKTNSPSMDILISSNLERLLYLLSENDEEVRGYMASLAENKRFEVSDKMKAQLKSFGAYSINQEDTKAMIKDCFEKHNYLIDPHTAVSYGAFKRMNSNNHVLVVSTASPYKFTETILEVFGESCDDPVKSLKRIEELSGTKMPQQLNKILSHKVPPFKLTRDEVDDRIFSDKVFEVSVPGTSANVGPGFDVAGIALGIYNTWRFEQSKEDAIDGYSIEKLENHMVLQAYRYYFKSFNEKYIPVHISVVDNNVPESRGLGSSSTCIVAGLKAANEMLNRKHSDLELLKLAAELEGHPDNASPALFGGFVTTWFDGNEYHPVKHPVNTSLKFIVAIPNAKISTHEARKVLPSFLKLDDIKFNASRLVAIPDAFARGDVVALSKLLEDKLHTPYRIELIPDGNIVRSTALNNGCAYAISGSGSTQLIISSDENVIDALKANKYSVAYDFKVLAIDDCGATIKGVKHE